jgi:hypothetical protein
MHTWYKKLTMKFNKPLSESKSVDHLGGRENPRISQSKELLKNGFRPFKWDYQSRSGSKAHNPDLNFLLYFHVLRVALLVNIEDAHAKYFLTLILTA